MNIQFLLATFYTMQNSNRAATGNQCSAFRFTAVIILHVNV